jgi:hypothetical protein
MLRKQTRIVKLNGKKLKMKLLIVAGMNFFS